MTEKERENMESAHRDKHSKNLREREKGRNNQKNLSHTADSETRRQHGVGWRRAQMHRVWVH